MKQISLEGILFGIAYIVHAIAPILFYASWIFLILLGQRLVKDGSLSCQKLFFSILVGAPIGVLSALSIQDYFGTSQNVSALMGCGVAIVAEQILNGDIIRKVSDALINKIGGQ